MNNKSRKSSVDSCYALDSDNERPSIGLNRGMYRSNSIESISSDIYETVATETVVPTDDSMYNRRHCPTTSHSLKRTTAKKKVPCSSKKKISPSSTNDCEITRVAKRQNITTTTTAAHGKLKVKSANSKPKIISDVILSNAAKVRLSLIEHYNLNIKSNLCQTTSETSDDSSKNWSTMEELTMSDGTHSDLWFALSALEQTSTDDCCVNQRKENYEILEKLSKEFDHSPRRFTESLLTIMEETLISSDVSQFETDMKKHKNNKNEISAINTDSMTKKQNIFDTSSSTFLSESNINDQSTAYFSPPNLAKRTPKEPSEPKKKFRSSMKIYLDKNTNNRKIVEKRSTPKPAMSHRLRIGSSDNNDRTPRKNIKAPKVVVEPSSPLILENQPKGLEHERKLTVDDDYFTAPSENEDSPERTIQPDEPLASSSQRFDMSRIASCHNEWVKTYEKASQLKSRDLSTSLKDELKRKREKCFNAVEQLLAKDIEVIPAKKSKPIDSSVASKPRKEFLETLKSCWEYFAYYGSQLKKACDAVENTRKYLTTLHLSGEQMRLGSRRTPRKSPTLVVDSVIDKSRTPKKSPTLVLKRRSVCKVAGNKVFSPSFRETSTYSGRRSIKGSATPVIDKSEIRSVRELRKVFSPTLRKSRGPSKSPVNECGTDCQRKIVSQRLQLEIPKIFKDSLIPRHKSNSLKSSEKENCGRKVTNQDLLSPTPETASNSRKKNATPIPGVASFEHVISPVAQYIRGSK